MLYHFRLTAQEGQIGFLSLRAEKLALFSLKKGSANVIF